MYEEGFLILRKVSNIQQTNNAPVKLFCPLPPQPGVRGKMQKEGRGTRKKGDFRDYIVRGKEKISDKKTRATQKK